MLTAIKRSVTVTAVLATTEQVMFGEALYALVYVPTGSTITSLTFHAAPDRDGTYLALYDTNGDAVVLTVEGGRAYPVPSACQGAAAVKMVGDAGGDVVVTWQG